MGAFKIGDPNKPPGFKLLPRTVVGSCFPYGVVRRIRFEGFEDGTCPLLSPAPQALLNEVDLKQTGNPNGFKSNFAGEGKGAEKVASSALPRRSAWRSRSDSLQKGTKRYSVFGVRAPLYDVKLRMRIAGESFNRCGALTQQT